MILSLNFCQKGAAIILFSTDSDSQHMVISKCHTGCFDGKFL